MKWFDKYPYTDFHELNLDWLIHRMKYWYLKVKYTQQAIATTSEGDNQYYENAHSAGDLIWWKDQFYRLTKDVAAGDDIDCHSLEHISVEDLLDEEEAARIAADSQLQDNIDAEEAARKAADSAEASARQAADTTLQNNINSEASTRKSADDALDDRIDKEITDRTNADSNLQSQITSNDTDIANLQSCCSTVQNTIANHETRITNNTTDITNITNQINAGTSSEGVRDTNTLTQLTYHQWTSADIAGSDTALTSLFATAYTKIASLVAAGTHPELIRLQIYGAYTGTSTYGLYATGFLNASGDGYEFTAVDDSTTQGMCSIYKFQIQGSGSYRDEWQFSSSTGSFTYTRGTDLTSNFNWHVVLVYQTADYIEVS